MTKGYPTYVMVIDIDGTIIGNINAQIAEYNLVIQSNSKERGRENANLFRGKMFSGELIMQLLNGLMRPGFAHFCMMCKRHSIPIFLYTAAEDEWAQFIVPCIERAVQFEIHGNQSRQKYKFAGLFPRSRCTKTGYKSLGSIMGDIRSTLISKWTMNGDVPETANKELMNRAILIDNNDVLIPTERSKWVPVETYDYAYIYDVTTNIPRSDTRRMTRAVDEIQRNPDGFLSKRSIEFANKNFDVASNTRAWLFNAMAFEFQITGKNNEKKKVTDKLWSMLEARLDESIKSKVPGIYLAKSLQVVKKKKA